MVVPVILETMSALLIAPVTEIFGKKSARAAPARAAALLEANQLPLAFGFLSRAMRTHSSRSRVLASISSVLDAWMDGEGISPVGR